MNIYSTLTCDQTYTIYRDPVVKNAQTAMAPIPQKTIVIYGKANITNDRLVTPKGVVTTIKDEDLQDLLKNKIFQRHVKRGYIIHERSKKDPDDVAANMTPKDESAPKTGDMLKNEVESKAQLEVDEKSEVIITTNTEQPTA